MSIKDFTKLQKQVVSLAVKEKFKDALLFLENAKNQFPNKLDKIGHWKAQIHCLQNDNQKAMAELNEGLRKGIWWNPEILNNDPELNPLKESKEFKMIIEKCEKLYNVEKRSAKPTLQIQGNPNADTSIFSLHWKGSNAKDFSPYWDETALLQKYLMGFPQSSQLFSYESYSWDNADIAKKDIQHTFNQFNEKYNLDEKENIITGASQGGNIAVELGLTGTTFGFNGFISVVPALENTSLIEGVLKSNPDINVRGCIITGDQDPFYEKVLETSALFDAWGVPCKLIVKEGMGHFFPDDFPQLFQQAVDYVLKK